MLGKDTRLRLDRETSPPAAPLLIKERFKDAPVPLLDKERLGEVSTLLETGVF